jgi:hypothetical protein
MIPCGHEMRARWIVRPWKRAPRVREGESPEAAARMIGAGRTTAATASPKSACRRPTTAHSSTPGSASIPVSTSFGQTLKPPVMIRSLALGTGEVTCS